MNNFNRKTLPFRPGVGMMIINKNNQVFLGKRLDAKNSFWQMPQGGIDVGETPSSAALREMEEEIGTKNGYIIAESKKWYSYRLPNELIPKLWDGKYCGQKQKWFLIRFIGEDSEIKLDSAEQEFEDWRWEDVEVMLRYVIPFKCRLYKKVMHEFAPLLMGK